MNIFSFIHKMFEPQATKPTPADFRRGARKVRAIGFLPDLHSRHVGSFKGSITPMKRRFKGVSRTANHKS